MFWEVNFNFWTISPDRSVPCFSCLGFPHFLLILVSVFHLGASVKCPVSLDVCEWDPKEVAEVVCLERAANQRLHRSDVGEFAKCWPLRNSQMPVSVFHSGVFQLLQKMLVYSAVLGEGQLQPREGGGDLSIRYVGTSRFQSRGLPAPPLFLVSLSSSPVLSSSARGTLCVSFGEEAATSGWSQGEDWGALEIVPDLSPRLPLSFRGIWRRLSSVFLGSWARKWATGLSLTGAPPSLGTWFSASFALYGGSVLVFHLPKFSWRLMLTPLLFSHPSGFTSVLVLYFHFRRTVGARKNAVCCISGEVYFYAYKTPILHFKGQKGR